MNIIHALLLIIITLSFNALANEKSSVSPAFLQSLQAAPKSPEFFLLDVRSPQEYQSGHIAHAVNISYDELANKLSLLPKNKHQTIIVYCRSGRRADIAEQLLREKGYTQVRHLQGDMNGWQENNLPVSTATY